MRYFEPEDILYLAISDDSENSSIELSPNITAEYNDKGEIIGIEILNASDFIRDSIADLETFCQEKGIAEWYSKIPGLLESHFPNLEGIEFSLQEDDESEDVFVEVLFSVAGDPEKINDYYDRFLDTWVEEVPAEARAYFQILLDIVEQSQEHKYYVLNENQVPIAVQIPVREFERLEEAIEDHGLAQLINEVQDEERLTGEDAYNYYKELKS